MHRYFSAPSAARWFAGCTLSLLLVAGLGCGSGKKTATVTGNVQYRGRPLPAGTVTFVGANKEIVGNGSIVDGNYSVTNVPVGPVKIAVTTPPAIMADKRHPAPQDMPGSSTSPIVPIPPRYGNAEQSGLTYEVHSGTQEHPIELH